MPPVDGTSGHLYCELVRFEFLQTHRETDRFFPTSGVQFTQHNPSLPALGVLLKAQIESQEPSRQGSSIVYQSKN
jgi:hypothetical protein